QEVVDRDLTQEGEETEPAFFASPKRLIQTVVVVLLLLAAIYILVPKIVGTTGAIGQLGDASPAWLVVALAFTVLMFASYVALFRGVVGEHLRHLAGSEADQIMIACLAAPR